MLEAARCFAAALVCPDGGCGACNACRRARSARHPDVIEVEPAGTFVVVDQVEEMMKEAFTSPFEAERKVIVLTEADRMNEPAANKLLKTLEEPPARTHFLLLSEAPDELLPTVRSRCQRIDFAALSDADVAAGLVAAGVSPEAAAAAARLASGRLDRARSLASGAGLAALRAVALEVAGSLDGSGGAAAVGAEGIQAVLADTLTGLEKDQKQEAKALETELTEAGYPDRLARRLRTRSGAAPAAGRPPGPYRRRGRGRHRLRVVLPGCVGGRLGSGRGGARRLCRGPPDHRGENCHQRGPSARAPPRPPTPDG